MCKGKDEGVTFAANVAMIHPYIHDSIQNIVHCNDDDDAFFNAEKDLIFKKAMPSPRTACYPPMRISNIITMILAMITGTYCPNNNEREEES